MSVEYDTSMSGQPDPGRPKAYTDLLLRVQDWEFGGKHIRIPVSGYASGKLALAYGFPDLETFCADLPEAGEVLDVGAGVSPLGLDVCRLRPDIRWTSADILYRDQQVYDRLRAASPPNLTLLPADIVDLGAATGGRQYNRVLSSYLYLHLWKAGAEPVLGAARQMLAAAAPAGKLSAGPINVAFRAPYEEDPYRITGQAITLNTPANDEELEKLAHLVTRSTKLPKAAIRSLTGPLD
jgi:hypothetical protein